MNMSRQTAEAELGVAREREHASTTSWIISPPGDPRRSVSKTSRGCHEPTGERLSSMNTWIALLRGINMVGKRKLPMKELIP